MPYLLYVADRGQEITDGESKNLLEKKVLFWQYLSLFTKKSFLVAGGLLGEKATN